MADPISWAMIAVNVASQAASGLQEYQQGMQDAAVAGQNAQIATDNAARARLDASRAEEAQRVQSRKAMGRAWAASAQSGAAGSGPGQGSFGALNTQSGKDAELDALNIRYDGEMEAFGDLTQAAQFRAERKAAKQRARGGLISGVLGSASAALSGSADYRSQNSMRPTTGGSLRTAISTGRKPRSSGVKSRAPSYYNYGSY